MHPAVPPLKAVFVSIKIICIKEKKTLARVHDNLISLSRVHHFINIELIPNVEEEKNLKAIYVKNFETTLSSQFFPVPKYLSQIYWTSCYTSDWTRSQPSIFRP